MRSYGLIEVSQVTTAESPLIGQLADTIFDDGGATEQRLVDAMCQCDRPCLALIAHLEGNPLAYAVALAPVQASDDACEIISLAVLNDYRREKVGSRLLEQVQAFAQLHQCRRLRIACPLAAVEKGSADFLSAAGFVAGDGGVVWSKRLG